jgi:hypothetical protein
MGGLNTVGNLIRGVAALIAIFPAAAVVFGLVDVPPTLIQLVKIISFSVSLIVLLGVFLLRSWILALSNGRAALLGLVAVALGAISLTTYYQYANGHTIVIEENPPKDRYFIVPLNPSEAILSRVRPFGGDYEEALRMSTQRETLAALMERQRSSSLAVMILLLVVSQVLLVAPVVAAAWKLAGTPALLPEPGATRTDPLARPGNPELPTGEASSDPAPESPSA